MNQKETALKVSIQELAGIIRINELRVKNGLKPIKSEEADAYLFPKNKRINKEWKETALELTFQELKGILFVYTNIFSIPKGKLKNA